ncbi:CatA-like O-acetyltransferase [Rugamonas rubra]|uniref:Chloramphenicol acetyltransferase n=1 Tax=Rugamonas rubra TaxID=758825 RepID=A0A1I4RFL3_9BURK|nr:CatA-like O-acetyltransferase [Rugamonas rubra]SFM50713.1 Chloramphenicol acetyltransferase [Rugamonas rubra]
MKNFEHRRDRFELFAGFDNPRINLGMALTLPDFRPFCKARQLPPFHFFLYCLLDSVQSIDNFLYRVHDGEVIKIEQFYGSYTVLNQDNNLNYARFVRSPDLAEFVERSVAAGRVAQASRALINTGADLSPREMRDNVYNTCLPWLDLTAIEHPLYRHHEADIPLIAWGRFSAPAGATLTLPFSIQAHHGFVDGYHVHRLTERLAARIAELIG